jgi:uncharacterized surface protein with fasciclin (FAS1) repeats
MTLLSKSLTQRCLAALVLSSAVVAGVFAADMAAKDMPAAMDPAKCPKSMQMAKCPSMSDKACAKKPAKCCKWGKNKQNIVDTAAMNGQFTTLGKALEAAGLTDTLKGKGPFTLFAPTDAAFSALPPGTLDELLKPENRAKLQQVLTYHVVPGNVSAKTVKTLKEAKTVEGSDIRITQDQDGVMINNANVLKTDIKTSNGVIHIIDRVLIPTNKG